MRRKTIEKEPLISVIIPVYKVEGYLNECVQSILSQTYKNLEIILVDDGSPDRCPQMCDDYAVAGTRVRVIHRKNGGLSRARNSGMEIANGDYIAFVDSDDSIQPNLYETLIRPFMEDDEICVTSTLFWRFRLDGKKDYMNQRWYKEQPYIVKGRETIKDVINENVSSPIWNKLFKKEVIENIRFKPGRYNQDWLFMFEVSLVMSERGLKMVELPFPLYNYMEREGSILQSKAAYVAVDTINNMYDAYKECIRRSLNEEAAIMYKRYVVHILWASNKARINKWPYKPSEWIEKKLRGNDVRSAFNLVGKRHKIAIGINTFIPCLWNVPQIRRFCLANEPD